MVPAMVGGASLTLVSLLVNGQSWAPYVPWACPYLISSGEIADYGVSLMIPYELNCLNKLNSSFN